MPYKDKTKQRAAQLRWQKAKIIARRARGLCAQCGKRKSKMRYCKECRHYRQEHQKDARLGLKRREVPSALLDDARVVLRALKGLGGQRKTGGSN